MQSIFKPLRNFNELTVFQWRHQNIERNFYTQIKNILNTVILQELFSDSIPFVMYAHLGRENVL